MSNLHESARAGNWLKRFYTCRSYMHYRVNARAGLRLSTEMNPARAVEYAYDMRFNYDGRVFRSVSNSENGEAGAETFFHYHQQQDVVWAAYGGGKIMLGNLLAKVNPDGSLDMRYQHLNHKGEFMTGECHSVPEVLPDGRYRLHEKWHWTCGDRSSGESIVEETTQD